MNKTAILLMLLTIFSKVFGFARDITLSYFYGASNISDAYIISTTIPIVIFTFIGVGISTGYIPMYSKVENKKGTEEANRFTNNLINTLLIICTVLVAIGLVFTSPLVKLFASGFEGETLSMAIKFTRISIVGIYFSTLIFVYTGFLQIKGNYTIPALIAFPMNIVTILSIIISIKTNNVVLAIGTVVATGSQLVFILPYVYKEGYRYKYILDIKDKYLISMAYTALPVILGTSINQINTLVDRTLASSLAEGGISALSYANKLDGFVQGIFVMSLITVMYPIISKMAAERNIDGLKKSVSEAIGSVNLLVIPATVGTMIFADPVVNLLFGRGAFDAGAVNMTANALFYYAIGMAGAGLRNVIARAFYSLQDTKTPAVNAAIAMVMNIVLNLILSRFLGIGGLALATSISSIVCTGLLFISLRKKLGAFGMKNIAISFAKILFASLVMGIVAKLAYGGLINRINGHIGLIISVGVGALVYFVMIYFMKIEEVDNMIKTIKKKFNRA